MADDHARPKEHFVHTQASHFQNTFFFYAFGNTPPVDLLQHIPHDATMADILSLGCGDLRDVLYSILLHGRRTISGGPTSRPVSFTLNDWEPAIQARNLVLLQLILDSRHLLDAAHTDGIAKSVAALGIGGDSASVTADMGDGNGGGAARKGKASKGATATADTKKGGSVDGVAFAQRIGVIFSAMYNTYVDADVLQTIQDVAGRLAASATSQGEWSSTELGRYVHFADDRSQARVLDILALYSDRNLLWRKSSARVKRERAAFMQKYFGRFINHPEIIMLSRSMGLASFRQVDFMGAYSSMRRQYLKEGLLNPFPLLLKTGGGGLKSRGPRDLVNPLLLVTEKKGMSYSLHYGAFPLDAFHIDVAWWKLRDESLQDDHGKLAPRVTERQDFHIVDCMDGSAATAKTRRGVQNAWFGTALEELAQMCGAFLQATTAAQAYLSLTIQVGDALNFCDALVSARSLGVEGSTKGTFEPLAFQQGTLQPLHLRPEYFGGLSTGFDVVNTSNLADHLGILNLLVASSPLLGSETHCVILTTYMSSVATVHLFQNTEEFYEEILCMNPSTAAILLGVVPVSSLSTVVGHTDTNTRLMDPKLGGVAGGQTIISRLTWKSPAGGMPPPASAVPRADITPDAFVRLTLPVYKAMFSHMPTKDILAGGFRQPDNRAFHAVVSVKHYTPVSFGRLLASAGRFLRLDPRHFEAALDAIVTRSGLILASNLLQEKIALFHSLGLVPIAQLYGMPVIPLDTRRVVLLVPKSGLSLLHSFKAPEVYLALTGKYAPFDNHFVSIHMAYVRVRRGGDRSNTEEADPWWSLGDHLVVQDAKETDHDAELMVSAVVPTFALEMAPAAHTELQLRPRDSDEMFSAPKDVVKRLGGQMWKTFYRADLANTDRTAILLPGDDDPPKKNGNSTAPLPCPKMIVLDRRHVETPLPAQSPQHISHEPAVLYRTVRDQFLFDQSLEVTVLNGRPVYRVTLFMANGNARELLADGGVAPIVEHGQGSCSVQVKFGEYGLTHRTHFPFPVEWKSIDLKFSKRQGYVLFTVPPLKGPVQVPFSISGSPLRVDNGYSAILPSSWCFPPCVPLRYLAKLDFNAEWAHEKIMDGLSFTPMEEAARKEANIHTGAGAHSGLLGMKESLLAIASSACTKHNEDRPIWKHPWMCITESSNGSEPAIWVWVNDVLLDSSNEAIVLDCCIMPTDQMGAVPSVHLGAAIERSAVLGSSGVALLKAYPAELKLWGSLLPVAVERARQTYAHRWSDCLYLEQGHIAASALCGCGRGQDLPPAFVESMTSVCPMDEGVRVESLFYRAALSPLYVPPGKACSKGKVKAAAGGTMQCGKCGRGGAAMLCSRCRKVLYCSKECQRQHWESHKQACQTA